MRCILLTTNRKPYEISHTPCQAQNSARISICIWRGRGVIFFHFACSVDGVIWGHRPSPAGGTCWAGWEDDQSRVSPTANRPAVRAGEYILNLLLLLHRFFSLSVKFFPFVAPLSYKSEIMEQCRTTGVPRHSGVPQEISKVPRKKFGI